MSYKRKLIILGKEHISIIGHVTYKTIKAFIISKLNKTPLPVSSLSSAAV
jgi:hypothetical protein